MPTTLTRTTLTLTLLVALALKNTDTPTAQTTTTHKTTTTTTPTRAPKPHNTHTSSHSIQDDLQHLATTYASLFNASVTLAVHNDSVSAAAAAGYADYATDKPMTTDTLVPMGSLTKMYTAVGVLRLAEEGLLHLDDRVAPLVDAYLARSAASAVCSEAPAQCEQSCVPIAHCLLSDGPLCHLVPKVKQAACSYCLRYLHCFANTTLPFPKVPTLRQLWDGEATIEEVTFRQLLQMTSGVEDYYFDRTNWLEVTTLTTTRDIEPLEYLVEMPHAFDFAPTSGRAVYSTNGFSLVGLALCGLLGHSDWAQLDQKKLAWGDAAPTDDQTRFLGRGTCIDDGADIAHQYLSIKFDSPYFDITNHSCLNSWTGGNIAARPLDVARFAHALHTGKLLNKTSLGVMYDWHPLTDEFGAGYLAYGTGLIGLVVDGEPGPMRTCGGLTLLGHAGEDFGSGAPVAGFVKELHLGVTLGLTATSGFGGQAGMNCSLGYAGNAHMANMLSDALVPLLAKYAGIETDCSPPSLVPPPLDTCVDAPSFGVLDGRNTTCDDLLKFSKKYSGGEICDGWLARETLRSLRDEWAPKAKQTYEPPPGVPLDTVAVELCRGACLGVGAGPCWLNFPLVGGRPWC